MKHLTPPQQSRRLLLQAAAAMPVLALARPALSSLPKSFAAETLEDALAELTGGQSIQDHPDIELDVPDIAEDSGKVPIQVYAPLPGAEKDQHPDRGQPGSSDFHLPHPGTDLNPTSRCASRCERPRVLLHWCTRLTEFSRLQEK